MNEQVKEVNFQIPNRRIYSMVEWVKRLLTEHYLGLAICAWLIAFFVPMLIVYAMSYLQVPPNINQSALMYIFLSAMLLWTLRLAPPLVAAIYLLLGMILLSLAPYEVALGGFYSDTFFLLISLSVLGTSIQTSGLSYRILVYLYQFNSKSHAWKQIVMFLSGTFITPVIPSANGRSYIVKPLFNTTVGLFDLPKSSMEYQRLLACSIGGFSLLSPIFLTSKSINLLAFGMLPEQVQQGFGFFYWLIAACLVGALLISFYALFIFVLFRNKQVYVINQAQLQKKRKELGSISLTEIATIAATLLFVLIVFTKSVHQLNIAWLALFLLVFIPLIIGSLKNKEFNKIVEWDFLIILSALLGFSKTISYLELDVWINYYLGGVGSLIEHNIVVFVLYLSIITFILRVVMPINVVVILLCSALIPVTVMTSINAWVVVFIILVFAETSVMRITTSYLVGFLELIDDTKSYWRINLLQVLVHLFKVIAILASIPFWQYLGLL